MQNLAINFISYFSIVFVIFVDTISITDIIASHSITKVLAIPFEYLLLSQMHLLGFQL